MQLLHLISLCLCSFSATRIWVLANYNWNFFLICNPAAAAVHCMLMPHFILKNRPIWGLISLLSIFWQRKALWCHLPALFLSKCILLDAVCMKMGLPHHNVSWKLNLLPRHPLRSVYSLHINILTIHIVASVICLCSLDSSVDGKSSTALRIMGQNSQKTILVCILQNAGGVCKFTCLLSFPVTNLGKLMAEISFF